MASNARFAEIAALAGDPARVAILHALMDGRALTASELAEAGGVSPQTASGHLGRLTRAGLVCVTRQGRHRYHSLASKDVARMMESIMQVAAAAEAPRPVRTGPRDQRLRRARTCYDHMAGALGVGIADALVADGHLELGEDAGALTSSGLDLLARLGIDPDEQGSRKRRVFCRPCLDWSERRFHLGGALGAALLVHSLQRGWVRRLDESRALAVSPAGAAAFRTHFGVALP